MEQYTTKEIADLFNVSNRAIVKRCSTQQVKMVGGRYLIPQNLLDKWIYKRNQKNIVHNVPNRVPINVPVKAILSTPNASTSEQLTPSKVIELKTENTLLQSKLQTLSNNNKILAQSNKNILQILRTLNNEVERLNKKVLPNLIQSTDIYKPIPKEKKSHTPTRYISKEAHLKNESKQYDMNKIDFKSTR